MYSIQTGVQCSAQAQDLDLRDLETSEKGGIKYLKCVFGKFEIGGLKDTSTIRAC